MTTNAARAMLIGAMMGTGGLTAVAAPALAEGGPVEGEEADNCANTDGAFNAAAFVIAIEPKAGARVTGDFGVRGCSRSFESNVQWKLVEPRRLGSRKRSYPRRRRGRSKRVLLRRAL